jgi:hypothetical protein
VAVGLARTMPTTIKLDYREPIIYESALKKDANIISQAAHFEAATELYQSLWDQRQIIQALVKHHLRLSNRDTCTVDTEDQWIRGSLGGLQFVMFLTSKQPADGDLGYLDGRWYGD